MKNKFVKAFCLLLSLAVVQPLNSFPVAASAVDVSGETETLPYFYSDQPTLFWKHLPGGEGLECNINFQGYTLKQIKCGEQVLADNDYRIGKWDEIIVKKDYLETLNVGKAELQFLCEKGENTYNLKLEIEVEEAPEVIEGKDNVDQYRLTWAQTNPTMENGWCRFVSIRQGKGNGKYQFGIVENYTDGKEVAIESVKSVGSTTKIEEECYNSYAHFARLLEQKAPIDPTREMTENINVRYVLRFAGKLIPVGPYKIDLTEPIIESVKMGGQEIQQGETIMKAEGQDKIAVTATDTMSGIWTVEYQNGDSAGEEDWIKAYDASEDNIDAATGQGKLEKTVEIPLTEAEGQLKIRVKDISGRLSAERSFNVLADGPGFSEGSKRAIEIYEGYAQPQEFQIDLKGTTIGSVKNGDAELDSVTDYRTEQGKLTIRSAYLNTLHEDTELSLEFLSGDIYIANTLNIPVTVKKVSAAAKNVIDQIAALDTDITLEQADTVAGIKAAYNALAQEEKDVIFNYSVWEQADKEIKELQEDQKQADQVIDQIRKIGTVTTASEAAIRQARTAYDKLTASQKALVPAETVAALSGAETKLAEIKTQEEQQRQENRKQADQVIDQIRKIGTVTTASEAAVRQARAAYNKLTEAQKALVPAEVVAALNGAEAKLAEIRKDESGKKDEEDEGDAAVSISSASVSGIKDMLYTGKKLVQKKLTVKLGGKKLKNGTDYTVTYKNNKKVGKATVTIKGKGNYTGSKKAAFRIRYNMAKAKIAKIGSQKYKKGKAIKPRVKVTYGGKTLKLNKDYTATYKNNKKVGKASVVIKGKGNYAGTLKKTFKIVKK